MKVVDLLLVEDNPGDVRLTEEALRDAGMPIHLSVAADGVEAVDFLHRRGKYKNAPRPDLTRLSQFEGFDPGKCFRFSGGYG